MKKNYLKFKKILKLTGYLVILTSITRLKAQTFVQTFSYTGGTQTFVVPSCVSSLSLDVMGASGGTSNPVFCDGGSGGRVTGVLPVTAGQTLNIYVGGVGTNGSTSTSALGGFNGGGNGSYVSASYGGGGGGGASDIRIGGTALSNRVVVAGGGGGGAYNYFTVNYDKGGAGGGLNGEGGYSGGALLGNGYTGSGGTQSSGGSAGNYPSFCSASSGSLGVGGAAGTCGNTGGGGGSGYYGGGGGVWAGGGGGSSYTDPSITNVVHTQGYRTGSGIISFTYNYNGAGVIASATSLSICSGAAITLSASNVSTYTWAPGGSNSTSISVSPTSNTSYTVQGTNSLGCISNAILSVTVDPGIPTLSVINTASASSGICPGKTVTLTASGATTYTWTGATSVTNGVSFAPTTTSGYTVTGGNACGTSFLTVPSISIHPLPSVSAVASSASLCSGSTATLTGVGTATSFVWSSSPIQAVSNGVSFIPNGTANYTVLGTSNLSCTNSAVTTITVVTTPLNAPVLSPALICIGKSSTITATGATNYTWLPGSFSNTNSIVVSPNVTTTYTLTKANSNCVDTKVFTITVNSLPPVVAIATPTNVCASNTLILSGGGANTYTWTNGVPGFSVTGANVLVSPPVNTIYTVAASDGTCINTTTVEVSTNPNPTITIGATSTVVCSGDPSTITVGGALSYTWNPSTITGTSAVVNPTLATLYTATGVNQFNCTSSNSQIILVNPLPPTNAVTNKTLVCSGNPATLTASGANTYQWDNGAGVPITVVNPVSTTIYTVVGTYSATGCFKAKTVTVTVFSPTFNVAGSHSTCIGGAITLVASGATNGYSWNTIPPYNFPSITVSPTVATVYIVSANTTSNGVTCNTSQSFSVSIYLNPTITAVAERTLICKNESGNLIAGGGNTYLWSTSQTGSIVPVSPTSLTIYSVTGTDANGCVGTATVSLKVSNCVGITQYNTSTDQLEIYPNPNNGEFTINSVSDITLKLTNELGQIVKIINLSSMNDHKVSVSNLANGIYFMSGEKDNVKINQKIIVNK